MPDHAPVLSLQHIGMSYARGPHRLVRVLDDVSLDVYAGEIVAVLGSRLSGKSTLLRIAAGLDPPDAGTVLFGGEQLRPTRRMRARRRSGEIALVRGVGSYRIPDRRRVLDCVAGHRLGWARDREARHRASALLDELGLTHRGGDRWGWLSDHDRVLVLLAGALVHRPRLLLADDLLLYMGGPMARNELARVLGYMVSEQGMGVLLTTDDVMAVANVDRIVSLDRGTLMAPEAPRAAVIQFPVKRASA